MFFEKLAFILTIVTKTQIFHEFRFNINIKGSMYGEFLLL